MTDHPADMQIIRLDEVDSTSLEARRMVQDGRVDDRPVVIRAETQTSGVGRFGRRWSSPPGGLWCTFVWPGVGDVHELLDGLGLRIGLACMQAVDATINRNDATATVQLKWPNDVMINGRKALGVLVEVVHGGANAAILIGVGVNANIQPDELPDDIRQRATSVRGEIGADVDLDALFKDVVAALLTSVQPGRLNPADLETIRARLFGVGRPCTISLNDTDRRDGILLGLNDEGRLELEVDGARWTAPLGAELAHIAPQEST